MTTEEETKKEEMVDAVADATVPTEEKMEDTPVVPVSVEEEKKD